MLKAAHYWELLIKTTTTTHSLAWLKLKALTVSGDRDVEQQELSLKHAHKRLHQLYLQLPKIRSPQNVFLFELIFLALQRYH